LVTASSSRYVLLYGSVVLEGVVRQK
jgi:hypothetical protein